MVYPIPTPVPFQVELDETWPLVKALFQPSWCAHIVGKPWDLTLYCRRKLPGPHWLYSGLCLVAFPWDLPPPTHLERKTVPFVYCIVVWKPYPMLLLLFWTCVTLTRKAWFCIPSCWDRTFCGVTCPTPTPSLVETEELESLPSPIPTSPSASPRRKTGKNKYHHIVSFIPWNLDLATWHWFLVWHLVFLSWKFPVSWIPHWNKTCFCFSCLLFFLPLFLLNSFFVFVFVRLGSGWSDMRHPSSPASSSYRIHPKTSTAGRQLWQAQALKAMEKAFAFGPLILPSLCLSFILYFWNSHLIPCVLLLLTTVLEHLLLFIPDRLVRLETGLTSGTGNLVLDLPQCWEDWRQTFIVVGDCWFPIVCPKFPRLDLCCVTPCPGGDLDLDGTGQAGGSENCSLLLHYQNKKRSRRRGERRTWEEEDFLHFLMSLTKTRTGSISFSRHFWLHSLSLSLSNSFSF